VKAHRPKLDARVADYVRDSYPHNLDYRVAGGRLKPRWKLRRRLRRIFPLYPEPLEELLDLSCSKGFFVLDAASRGDCRRAVGVDVHAEDLEASRAVAAHLGFAGARFERLLLPQLSASIEDFGGPFQTVLLVNTYPYLYFGSDRCEAVASDHEELFELLARVTAERLIFSNRLAFATLPRHIQRRAREAKLAHTYDEDRIRAAAQRHFTLQVQRPLGKIPLWLLRRRP